MQAIPMKDGWVERVVGGVIHVRITNGPLVLMEKTKNRAFKAGDVVKIVVCPETLKGIEVFHYSDIIDTLHTDTLNEEAENIISSEEEEEEET